MPILYILRHVKKKNGKIGEEKEEKYVTLDDFEKEVKRLLSDSSVTIYKLVLLPKDYEMEEGMTFWDLDEDQRALVKKDYKMFKDFIRENHRVYDASGKKVQDKQFVWIESPPLSRKKNKEEETVLKPDIKEEVVVLQPKRKTIQPMKVEDTEEEKAKAKVWESKTVDAPKNKEDIPLAELVKQENKVKKTTKTKKKKTTKKEKSGKKSRHRSKKKKETKTWNKKEMQKYKSSIKKDLIRCISKTLK